MKKLIYILLISISTSLAFTACTEEDITPTEAGRNGGGGISDPKSK